MKPTAATPLVSIIIPVWNLWDMTRACLESLAQHTERAAVEIIVVDNGSTDATATALAPTGEQLFGSHFCLLRNEHNLGFAKACNAGAQAASAPLLFFLNNDTLVTPHWLPPLMDSLEASPLTGMVGPLLLFPGSQRVQHCGITFAPTLEVSHLYDLFPKGHPLIHKKRYVQALTGAAFLLRRETFFHCGPLHEGYQNGFEDLDLCCILRQHNLRLHCVPSSVIYHLTSQTPGRADHDAPNARLLNERQPAGFVPDLHRIGAEDGYCARLNPSLEMYLTLPDTLAQALTSAFSSNFSEDRCRARLEADPLWEQGYSLLAQHLESRHAHSEAVDVRSDQVHFFPLAPYALGLMRCAARAGDESLARTASEAATYLMEHSQNTEALIRKAHKLALWSREVGDMALADIFSQWLEERGLPPPPA